MKYFWSDTHFSHNLMKEKRNFSSIEDHDEYILSKINDNLSHKDELFLLGDISFRKNVDVLFRRMICKRKYIILGNHDRPNYLKSLKNCGIVWVKDTYQVKCDNTKIWLSHYPHRSWPSKGKGSIHLHGHVHGTLPEYGRSMDVGVDSEHGKSPISIDFVIDRFKNVDIGEF